MGRRVLCALGLLVATAGAVSAWQWPVRVVDIQRTFGQEVDGYLNRGIEFGGGAQPVFPVEEGVVVASRPEASSVPSGLGTYVVVEHEQGFRSIYAHLEAATIPPVGQAVGPDTQIGTVGETGQVAGRALRLYIVDLQAGDYVNPMLLLPDLPDNARPTIGAVYAVGPSGRFDLREIRVLPPGSYEITAEVRDRLEAIGRQPILGPYSIRMFVSGQEAFAVELDRMRVGELGMIIEPGGLEADLLYAEAGLLRLGTVQVTSGQTELEIVSVDFRGNEASLRLNLSGSVNEDL